MPDRRASSVGGARRMALCLALFFVCGGAAAIEEVDEVLRVLGGHGIAFDPAVAKRAAIEGLLKTVDPFARLLSEQEALCVVEERQNARGTPPVLAAEEWPGGLRYLRVGSLFEEGGAALTAQLQSWSETNTAGIVIDLRDATGDDFDSVARVANLFADAGELLFTTSGGPTNVPNRWVQEGRPPLSWPLAVVVDDRTRQAAEILAAVLSECPGAVLVGAQTRGNPYVRELIPLSGGEMLHIAVRRVVLPNGVACSQAGVWPDILVTSPDTSPSAGPGSTEPPAATQRDVALSGRAARNQALLDRVGDDAALGRAVDVLLALKALGIRAERHAQDIAD